MYTHNLLPQKSSGKNCQGAWSKDFAESNECQKHVIEKKAID